MAINLPPSVRAPQRRPQQPPEVPPTPTPRPDPAGQGYQQLADTLGQAGIPHLGLSPDMAGGMQQPPPMVPPEMLGAGVPVPTPRPDFNPMQNAIDAAPNFPPVPTPRPDMGAPPPPPVPTPNPGMGAPPPPPAPNPLTQPIGGAPPPDMDPRAALAQAMAHQQAFGNERANSAGYTTSGPGWAGGNTSAIFGGRGR